MDMDVRISILFIYTNSRERGKEREKQVIYSIDLNKVCIDIFFNVYILSRVVGRTFACLCTSIPIAARLCPYCFPTVTHVEPTETK